MKSIQLNIPEPCHEVWDNMTPEDKGRHCDACQKIVVDFTAMSDQEIIKYFKKHANERICGRSKKSQLNRNLKSKTSKIINLKSAMIAASITIIPLPLFCQTQSHKIENIQSENKHTFSLSGVIFDGNGAPVISCNVVIEKNGVFIKGVATDINGKYSLIFQGEKLSEFQMNVSCIGFENQIIHLNDHPSTVHTINVMMGEAKNIDIQNADVIGYHIPIVQNDHHSIQLKGVIKEENESPAISANVILSQNGNFIRGVATDFEGNYLFDNLAPGVYDITVSYIGFNDKKISDVNVSDNNIELDVYLEEGEIVLGVTVMSRRERFWYRIKDFFRR